MKCFLSIFFVAIVLLSCSHKNEFAKEISILDSTKIVLQVKLNELKRSEANSNNSGFQKFEMYKSFLHSKVKDTVAKHEATAISLFLNSGNTILEFNKMNTELIKQTELNIQQIQKLSSDLKENNLKGNAAQAYFNTERSQADEIIKTIEQNIKTFNINLINYRNCVIKTEEYIKTINNGQLPTVVTDSNI